MHQALTPVLSPVDVREARRRLQEHGTVAHELLGPQLARSWQRSQLAGLQPTGRTQGAPYASAGQLARALDRQHELVLHAQPVMEFLHEQTRDTDSMVILADADGMLLHALGDGAFMSRAERVALRPGATWHEHFRGANAIGAVLAEGKPMAVHAGEHYLERNAFLTCAAAPILDPSGRLLGALDLSADHRSFHRHTLGLVRSAVKMIEHRLFETRHGASWRLRLHNHVHGIGTQTEGLLALSADGWIVGANAAALAQLGLGECDIGAVQVDQVLGLTLVEVHAAAGHAPQQIRTPAGRPVWLRVDAGRQTIVMPLPAPAPCAASGAIASVLQPLPEPVELVGARDALAVLDTGDPTLASALARVRRVLDKPIALLLQGESGVGKEVFARAVHASGPRRDGPLVAVNCAALPESLIEAELFGYRPGAFTGASRDGAPGRIREAHGGTLFLDEIGDMPLAMQGRLLRVLQERQVVPLGGGKPVPVDFSLICATHRRLRGEMEAGRFREDLYYRLNGLTLLLPPLRERQDLGALIERLLAEMAPQRRLRLTPELAQAFRRYRWPGNLRQLANALRTACALLADGEHAIDWCHLPDDLAEDLTENRPDAGALDSRVTEDQEINLDRLSLEAVRLAIERSQGNLSEAARRLGISRNTLYRRLRDGRGRI